MEKKDGKDRSLLSGVRILLVEDSPDNRLLIKNILSRKGAAIEFANNGREGVDLALKQEFDLILMDIQMPVLDGLQATAELRQKGFRKPIIALTAHAMTEERAKTLAVGCNEYLTKPIEVAKLVNAVAKFADRSLAF